MFLGDVVGEFRQCLGGGDADADGDAELPQHFMADGEGPVPDIPEAGQFEEGLIDAVAFLDGREVRQQPFDAAAYVGIKFEIA